jgi:hypothetical protein
MQYYKLQVALKAFLLPKSLSLQDSNIVQDSILKLAGIKHTPDIFTLGSRHTDWSVDFSIDSLSAEDVKTLDDFLKQTCGNDQVDVEQSDARNDHYNFQLSADAFYHRLLPLIKEEIHKLPREQLRLYQQKSVNDNDLKNPVRFYSRVAGMYKQDSQMERAVDTRPVVRKI